MDYYLIIICIILIIWNIRLYTEFPETLVVSRIDGGTYSVKKNHHNKQEASDILARLNAINNQLISHLKRKYQGTNKIGDISYLYNNYNGDVLQEHTPRGPVNTSYVLNKGDVVKLCLRDPITNDFHDFNTLLFVNFHELSHLLDRKWGHSDSFWSGFRFILIEAVRLNMYTPVDYRKTPASYCGISITSSPLFP